MRRRATLAAVGAGLLCAAALAGCSCSAPATSGGKPPAPKPAVWPLLGTRAPSAEAVRRRVVVVKVENEPPARPQSGLAAADVVYETPIEGGDTRYAALYHSRAPSKVGPVRSGRVSDSYIVPQYRALLARIGGDYVVETTFKQTPHLEDMNEFKNPAPYFRVSCRRAPHNLYVDVPALRKAAEKRGFEPALDAPGLAFGSAPASATAAASEIAVTFSPVARARWTWADGRWRRAFDGSRAGDAGSGRPYEAANVVVLFVERLKTKALDPAGNPSYDDRLVGTGKAVVFRGGKRYDGTWTAGRDAPPRVTSASGEAIPLAPGATWFEVLPLGGELTSR